MNDRTIDNDRRRILAAIALAAAGGVAPASAGTEVEAADAPQDARGVCVPIGGALRFDNDAVWSRLVSLSQGSRGRWAVFGTASTHPERSAQQVIDVLHGHGAGAQFIPLVAGQDAAAVVRDGRWIDVLRHADGVFFCGGAQQRIVDTLMPGGVDTPLLEAIRHAGSRGGVIAGTSAGAAIMSTTMFRDAQEVLPVLKGQLRRGQEIDRGLGFVGPRLFVDQHFLRRGRIGRMLPMMVASGYTLGLGVDENTAAIVRGDQVEVLGGKGALLVDLSAATHEMRAGAFSLRGARLTYLDRGDRFDLASGRIQPSAQKLAGQLIDPGAASFKPYFARSRYWADILGDSTIVDAMCELVDSADREAFGLAADLRPPASDPRPDLAFEFRLWKDAGTRAWFTGAFGGEDYTVQGLRLDVEPIRLAQAWKSVWSA